MKKVIAILFVISILVFGLFGCVPDSSSDLPGKNDITDNTDSPGDTDQPDTPVDPEVPADPDAPHTHVWDDGKTTKESTCKESGVITYTCACGETKSEEIAKLAAHIWDEGEVTKEPTCKELGVKTYTCVCGEIKTDEIAKLNVHTWDAGVITKEATCKDSGVKTFTCSVCGEVKSENIAVFATHQWNSGKIMGTIKVFSCDICKTEKTEKVDRLNILILGGAALTATARDSDVLLGELLKTNAGIKNIRVDKLDFTNSMSRLDYLFSWTKNSSGSIKLSGVSSDSSIKDTYNNIKSLLSPDASLKYDYVIIPVANNWNIVDGQSYGKREEQAFSHFEEMIFAHNPNATLIISTSAPLERYVVNSAMEFYSGGKAYYFAENEHGCYKKIYKQAENVKKALESNNIKLNVMISDAAKTWINVWESGEAVCDMYNDGYTWPSGKDDASVNNEYKFFYYPFEATAYSMAATWFYDISGIDPSVITITQWQREGGLLRDILDDGEMCDLDIIKSAVLK